MFQEKNDRASWIGKRNILVFKIIKTITVIITLPFFRIKKEGIENIPHENAFVLLPKHQRWMDVPLLGRATPFPLYYIAKHQLFLNPVSRWLVTSLGGLPLNRERPIESRQTLRAMIGLLHKGEGIVIFPEGTYFIEKMGPGNVGIVRLILSRLSLPFVPVGIRYRKKLLRTHVRFNYGTPIHCSDGETPEEFLTRLMAEIARLSGLR